MGSEMCKRQPYCWLPRCPDDESATPVVLVQSLGFRIICDEVRNVLAKKYLTETEISVEDIAHLLGCTEMTNFRRAFIRWNKMAPGKFCGTPNSY